MVKFKRVASTIIIGYLLFTGAYLVGSVLYALAVS